MNDGNDPMMKGIWAVDLLQEVDDHDVGDQLDHDRGKRHADGHLVPLVPFSQDFLAQNPIGFHRFVVLANEVKKYLQWRMSGLLKLHHQVRKLFGK